MDGIWALIISPIVGAVIGYFTNWLAIKMLFRPRTKKYIGKIKLPFTPGLIPKNRERLTQKVAQTVGDKLLPADVLINELTSPKTTAAIVKLLDEMLNNLRRKDLKISDIMPDQAMETLLGFAGGKIPDVAKFIDQLAANEKLDVELSKLTERIIKDHLGSFVGMFFNAEKIYKNIKLEFLLYIGRSASHEFFAQKLREGAGLLSDVRVNDLLDRIGEERVDAAKQAIIKAISPAVAKAAEFIANTMDVSGMVSEKMNAFSIIEAEEIILSVVHRELNAITILGGVLGFIIGLSPALVQNF